METKNNSYNALIQNLIAEFNKLANSWGETASGYIKSPHSKSITIEDWNTFISLMQQTLYYVMATRGALLQLEEVGKALEQNVSISEVSISDKGELSLLFGSGISKEVTIPVVTEAAGGVGLLRVGNLSNGQMGVRNINGAIALAYPEASVNGFTQRKAQGSQHSGVVGSKNFDLAVKTAMTDGIGDAWTEVERAAARARMGAVSLEEVLAVIKPMLGSTYFPTGEAGFYRDGTNFTELLCTWDEYIANGVDVDGQHYEGGIHNSNGSSADSGYLLFSVPADVIIPQGYNMT